jgi:hypothetical protein
LGDFLVGDHAELVGGFDRMRRQLFKGSKYRLAPVTQAPDEGGAALVQPVDANLAAQPRGNVLDPAFHRCTGDAEIRGHGFVGGSVHHRFQHRYRACGSC